MRVDLPSSTEPAVAMRNNSELRRRMAYALWVADGADPLSCISEITFTLAILHRRLSDAIVGAGLPALGDSGGGDLSHHLLERDRAGAHGAGAGHVAHCA